MSNDYFIGYCSTLEQLQIANETLQNENKRLISEMDELRTQVGNTYCFFCYGEFGCVISSISFFTLLMHVHLPLHLPNKL